MYPFVPAGAVLTVEHVEASRLRVGDVVCVLDAAGETVAHRLTELVAAEGPLRLRGDAGFGLEEVPLSALIGRVVRVERGPLRYSTDGMLGQLLAQVALQHRGVHRALSLAGRALVRMRRGR